jgi:hypothetical protein
VPLSLWQKLVDEISRKNNKQLLIYVQRGYLLKLKNAKNTKATASLGSARYFYGLNTYSAILPQKSLFLFHSSFMAQHFTLIFREMLYNHGNFAA